MRIGVLGGGLAGLVVASRSRHDCEVLELEASSGGHCRSLVEDGYTFDEGGPHILFSRNKEILDLLKAQLGANVAERFEFENLARCLDRDRSGVEVNGDDITVFQRVAEAFGEFARIKLAGGDAVAEENARETFGEDDFASGRAERDGRVFA